MESLKEFIKLICGLIFMNKEYENILYWVEENDKKKGIIDSLVYTKNQLLRLVNQSKFEKGAVILIMENKNIEAEFEKKKNSRLC